MADNVEITAGTGTSVASDDIGGVQYPRVKPAIGADGTAVDAIPVVAGLDTTATGVQAVGVVGQFDDVATSAVTENQFAPLRISARRALLVEGVASGTVLPVSDGGGTLTVDGTVAVTGVATAANQATQITAEAAIQTSVELIDDAIKADDAAFTPGTTKVMMAGFEFDDSSPDSVDEGDAGAARMSGRREVYTQIRDAAGNERGANVNASGQLTVAGPVTNAGTFAVQVDGNALTALQLIDDVVQTEDAAHSSGHKGVMALAVRLDSAGPIAGADGDYTPLQVDDNGALRVVGSSGTTQYAEDTAHASGDSVVFVGAIRRDTVPSSSAGSAADYTAINCDANGRLYTNSVVYTPLGDSAMDDTLDAVKVSIVGDSVGSTVDTDDGTVAAAQASVALAIGLEYVFDGTNWVRRVSSQLTDGAVFTANTTGVTAAGFYGYENTNQPVSGGDIGAARMTLDRKLITTPVPHTAGGLSIFKDLSLSSTNDTLLVVKNAPGQVYGMWVTNTATSTRFIKFWDATSGTLGSGTPVITIGIPGNATDDIAGNFGPGGMGLEFTTGICIGASTVAADNDATNPSAGDVLVNVFYK